MELPLTDSFLPIWKQKLAVPRALFTDWYLTVALYEFFCEKDALDIGCFTGANTVYLASIAKSKNRMVYSIDDFSRAHQAGISTDRAKGLFYAHLDLLDTREHCQLLVKDFKDITEEEIVDVDFIFHDVPASSIEQMLSLLKKIKSKTIFILDEWKSSYRLQNNFDIDVLLKHGVEEFYRTKNRFYGAVKYTKKEFDNIKNGVVKI